ncbi:type VII secretion-associated serine protease mycosin [Streptobacillus moniliformis]|nr:type VII secretion-associated serine protease mycosin [Streptobacillus moniliformis]
MSPEMQALARSESIFVKNSFKKDNELMKKFSKDFPISYTDIDNVQYIDRFKKDIPQVYPLLLRSATVGENGLLKADKEGEIPKFGSSFSSPRIARLAYDIKEKYPFLTYQQVKQVILGTASHANDGYLSDSVGWG